MFKLYLCMSLNLEVDSYEYEINVLKVIIGVTKFAPFLNCLKIGCKLILSMFDLTEYICFPLYLMHNNSLCICSNSKLCMKIMLLIAVIIIVF